MNIAWDALPNSSPPGPPFSTTHYKSEPPMTTIVEAHQTYLAKFGAQPRSREQECRKKQLASTHDLYDKEG
jgi:hypothetical protein